MATKNVNLISRPKHQFEKDMRKLECPFTWKMHIAKEDNKEHLLNDDEELFSLLQLMRHLMTIYVDTMAKIKSHEILIKRLEKCDEIMTTLRENNHSEISADVVHYVLQSSKCFVFAELNLPKKLMQVFFKIRKEWKMNSKERSTLKACRSICWSKYDRVGLFEAEHFIRDAIRENPNCELWYFILGKNLRRKRRDSPIVTRPCKMEVKSFVKAYSMSANPVFGVFLAQMYREMRKLKDAENIYNQIFEEYPHTGAAVLLRLAFGFVQLKNYEKARECVNKVGAVCPNHSMYLHYRGVYYFNCKNYKEAAEFLKEASKDNNIPAEKQYLDCAVMLNKPFDAVEYLSDMVSNPNHLPEDETQSLLDLAFSYWLEKSDVPRALIVHCAPSGKHWLFLSEEDYLSPSGSNGHQR